MFAFIPYLSSLNCQTNESYKSSSVTTGLSREIRSRFTYVIFIVLSALLLLAFTCGESIMFSTTTHIAIKAWGWSPANAALISTVILSGCLLGRIVSSLLSTWLKPIIILASNVILFNLGCVMMLLSQYVFVSEIFLWTSSVVLGFGSSGFNPTFMLFVNQHVTLTSRLSSLMLFSINTAWLVCPFVSVLLLERVGHRAVFQLMFTAAILSVVMSMALLIVSRKLMIMTRINKPISYSNSTDATVKQGNDFTETSDNNMEEQFN